jgi:heme-degrading monooxygenase HmoA
MVIEHAQISITPGREEEFEAAFEQVKRVIAQAPGVRGARLGRGVERPSVYQLLVEWDTVEDHTVGFRESDLFIQWRALIGEFFAEPPHVEHSLVIAEQAG